MRPWRERVAEAVAGAFGVDVAALFDGAGAAPAGDHWTETLRHLEEARRALAAADTDATPRPELDADARADVERAALAIPSGAGAARQGGCRGPNRAGVVGALGENGAVSGAADRKWEAWHGAPARPGPNTADVTDEDLARGWLSAGAGDRGPLGGEPGACGAAGSG